MTSTVTASSTHCSGQPSARSTIYTPKLTPFSRRWKPDGTAASISARSCASSFDSLGANKTRSALTMLGVIIGVASVVALLSLGNGAQATITSQIPSIGTNLIFVMPGSPTRGGPGGTTTAAEPDHGRCPGHQALGLPLTGIAPQFSGSADMVAPAADKTAQIAGTTPAYFDLQDLRPASGIAL